MQRGERERSKGPHAHSQKSLSLSLPSRMHPHIFTHKHSPLIPPFRAIETPTLYPPAHPIAPPDAHFAHAASRPVFLGSHSPFLGRRMSTPGGDPSKDAGDATPTLGHGVLSKPAGGASTSSAAAAGGAAAPAQRPPGVGGEEDVDEETDEQEAQDDVSVVL